MVNEMNFYVTAEPKHMDHLHAFYVAEKIVDHPSVAIIAPDPYKILSLHRENKHLARMLFGSRKEKSLDFCIQDKSYPIKGNIKTLTLFTGDYLEVNFGPFGKDLIQNAHDDLKKFMITTEDRLPSTKASDVGGDSHFHITITPNPKLFTEPKEIDSSVIEKVLNDAVLKRTGEIAHFDVCGFNGYKGRICGLAKDEVPFGVVEWEHGERSGIWNRYYLYPLM